MAFIKLSFSNVLIITLLTVLGFVIGSEILFEGHELFTLILSSTILGAFSGIVIKFILKEFGYGPTYDVINDSKICGIVLVIAILSVLSDYIGFLA